MEPSAGASEITAPPAAAGIRRDAIAGARAAAPLAVAVFGFAVSFGIVARAAGMGWWAPLAMSATTFAGSAQFAVASTLQAGGTITTACIAAVLLNSRYLPIGISVAPALRGGPLRRLLAAQFVVDESWAVAHLGGGRYSEGRLLGAGLLMYATWVAGTALGLLGAQVLGDPRRLGLDAVGPAIFLTLLVRQVHGRAGAVAALLGAAIALILTPLSPSGVPLIAAVAAALTGLWAKRGAK